jgi:VanZ family protein
MGNIPLDKLLHLLVGIIVGGLGFYMSQRYGLPNGDCFLIGIAAAVAIGIAKEIYDKYHPDTHTYDLMDAAYTAAGGAAGGAIWYFAGASVMKLATGGV